MRIAAEVLVPYIRLERRSGLALGRQLQRALRAAILHGNLPAGFRLPASRTLADALGVSRNAVLFAYEELTARRLLAARVGSGTRVAHQPPRRYLAGPDGLEWNLVSAENAEGRTAARRLQRVVGWQ